MSLSELIGSNSTDGKNMVHFAIYSKEWPQLINAKLASRFVNTQTK